MGRIKYSSRFYGLVCTVVILPFACFPAAMSGAILSAVFIYIFGVKNPYLPFTIGGMVGLYTLFVWLEDYEITIDQMNKRFNDPHYQESWFEKRFGSRVVLMLKRV